MQIHLIEYNINMLMRIYHLQIYIDITGCVAFDGRQNDRLLCWAVNWYGIVSSQLIITINPLINGR